MTNSESRYGGGRKRHLLNLLLILSLGSIIYSNTFHVPFVLDDEVKIVDNPVVKDFGYYVQPSDAAEAWRDNYTQFISRIVGYLTFTLNYKIHGLDLTGYHIFNLVVHLLNALLIYALVLAILKTPFLEDYTKRGRARHVAFFSGLLFVSHPIETQAVTYIVQRFASLATLFYLASFLAYVKFRLSTRAPHRVGFYALTLAFALLSLKTKEFAVTLPVTIAVFELCFFGDSLKKRLLYLIPLILMLVLVPLSYMEPGTSLDEISRVQTSISRTNYLLTQFTVIITYIRLLFFPLNQNLDYDYPVYDSFFNPAVILSFLFLASIVAMGFFLFIRSRHRAREMRLAAFGIFWFFITLLPESGLIPIADVIFEHRVYLPSAGFFIALSTCALLLKDMLDTKKAGQVLIGILALSIVIFTVTAHLRNYTWRDAVILWEDTVSKSPNKARVHNNLGYAYGRAGVYDKAIEHHKISLSLDPDDKARVHNNLGFAYGGAGMYDKAIEHFRISSSMDPNDAKVVFNLGLAYLQKGDVLSARREMEHALRLDPDNRETRNFLQYIYRIQEAEGPGSEHRRPEH